MKQVSEGTVQVVAQKGDVNVSDGSTTSTLSQGQQATVENSEKKKKKRRKAAAQFPQAAERRWIHPLLFTAERQP